MGTHDLVVLGAGNAGQAVAGAVRKAGWSVAIVESRDVGGVCPNRGCVPKKVFVAAATALDAVERAGAHAISVGPAKLDWQALVARKNAFVDPLAGAMSASLEARGIELFRGEARFSGPNSVRIGELELTAPNIVVATGSRPRPLSFAGADLLSTSEQFLSLETRPESAVFVGGGVVAFEFAHVLARVGTRVTILEVMPQPLGQMDADLVAEQVAHTRKLGIEVLTGVQIQAVVSGPSGLVVQFLHEGEIETRTAEYAFNGAGRVANVDNIDIDKAGVSLERGRPQVSLHLQSIDNKAVWFAGDALPATPQLSPVATYEGRIVGHNLLHPDDLQAPDYSTLPSAVFTIPALAQVGLTEAQAEAQGLEVETKVTQMKGWLSARTYDEPVAWAKVLLDRKADRIVGAHLIGHGAGEVIEVFALAIRYGIPASELATGLFAYPTFTNDVKYLL
ncbi:MAG: NAD(P)/FAD-dependent oxidoreductase [Proteobacteria bacterium]|nr:NAD(P)/FAD-dependent oxidoreductase [Pseudomonadota bacterium]